jgi:PAS domain S-box-containing protein
LAGEKCLLGMFQDITERLRAEERLSQLASIVESSDDSIIGIGMNGLVVSWNSAAEKLYQQSAEEVVGQPIALLFSQEHHTQLRQILARVKQGESVRDFETIRLNRQSRILNLSLTFSPIKNVKGTVVGASLIVRDVTQFKELQQQVVQTQKIETIGQLAGGVAHDFNNILMAIRGYCELLQLKTESEDARSKDIREIMRAADQGAALTRQLLAFSRKQMMVPKILDLNHVLNQMADMVRRLIGENIELSLQPAPELARIKADPGQVEQVILNLAVNAGDAMPAGGLLQVKTSNVTIDEDFARHNPEAVPGNYVLLRITDSGHGMDPETMSHIFEPFFTTKEKGRGTGLGLSTVYGIVKQTGGYIGVQSRRGSGTTFEVYFPSIQEAAIVHTSPSPFRPAQYNHTILLVDDNEPVRNALTGLLRMQGFVVLPASNGNEAEKIAREHPGKIHLLITDVVMPKMSGRELAKTLSSLVPDLKVLFISGYSDGLVNPAETDLSFLQKPVTLEALLSKLNELLIV